MSVLVLSPVSPDGADIIAALPWPAEQAAIVETAAQATAWVARGGIELVILDLAMADSLQFLRRQAASLARTPVICVADRRRPDASSEALRLGVADIIARPIRAEDLASAMKNAQELARIADRPAPAPDISDVTEGVFGASRAMRDVIAIVRRVARSRCGVLILGERGTGREAVARAIHALSAHRECPFIRVVCTDAEASTLRALLDDEGVEGTTVYLEDLCELAPGDQARLESFLDRSDHVRSDHENGRSEGGGLRFLASAPLAIADRIERGGVRRGLVERIGMVRIELPPLRRRAEDIPLLAMHFLKEACRVAGVPPKAFSRGALTLLAALPWRGNACELQSLTDGLAVLVSRGVVVLEDVLANVDLEGARARGRSRQTLREAREEFEREYLTTVLRHHRGRMGAAARDLGIERTNLYRKVKQLNIRWTEGTTLLS